MDSQEFLAPIIRGCIAFCTENLDRSEAFTRPNPVGPATDV